MVSDFLKDLIEKIEEAEDELDLIENAFFEKYGDLPIIIGYPLSYKERIQLKYQKKKIKELEKILKTYLKNGYHKAEPEIKDYKEWCKYCYDGKFLTKEDLEYENLLRLEYLIKRRIHDKETKA